MGHYWREMDPQGAAEHDRRIDRELRLRKEVLQVPLGAFMVEELEPLLRLLGLVRSSFGSLQPRDEDMEILEKALQRIKAST